MRGIQRESRNEGESEREALLYDIGSARYLNPASLLILYTVERLGSKLYGNAGRILSRPPSSGRQEKGQGNMLRNVLSCRARVAAMATRAAGLSSTGVCRISSRRQFCAHAAETAKVAAESATAKPSLLVEGQVR